VLKGVRAVARHPVAFTVRGHRYSDVMQLNALILARQIDDSVAVV
jgi:hypothetical protein